MIDKDNIVEIELGEETRDVELIDTANFDIQTELAEFPKYSVEEILEASKEIDSDKVAQEVLTWLNYNLENYIDNTVKMFKIPIDDLDVGTEGSREVPSARADLYPEECLMVETKRLQSLYRGIPEDDDATEEEIDKYVECRQDLDKIAEKAFESMKDQKDELEKLLGRMVYYYEFRGFDKTGKELVQDFEGLISIMKFEYEAFSVGVRITEGIKPDSEPDGERAVAKEYLIPEGFVVWMELALKTKHKPTGMF